MLLTRLLLRQAVLSIYGFDQLNGAARVQRLACLILSQLLQVATDYFLFSFFAMLLCSEGATFLSAFSIFMDLAKSMV